MSISPWILELNDSAVRVHRDGEVIDNSPGIALIDRHGILTGSDAHDRLCLDPRAINDRYWQQLNDAPLADASRRARHHADLAYHHLDAIFTRTGKPTELVIAPPAHYGDTELGLLLGICSALDLNVVALVDPAVAALAGRAAPGRYRVADLHLHHATVSSIEVREEVVRGEVTTVDQAGLKRIHTGCIDLVADAFLEQSRFDPLHEAATEQALHAELEGWLERATANQELDLTMDYHGSRFGARVAARELARVVSMVLSPLAELSDSASQLVLSRRFASLPGSAALFEGALTLPDDAVASGIAQHRLRLGDGAGAGVDFTTRLPGGDGIEGRESDQPVNNAPATHVVVDGDAYPLSAAPLLLHADGRVQSSGEHDTAASVRLDGGEVRLRAAARGQVTVNGMPAQASHALAPGDTIGVDSARFLIVRVHHAHAP